MWFWFPIYSGGAIIYSSIQTTSEMPVPCFFYALRQMAVPKIC